MNDFNCWHWVVKLTSLTSCEILRLKKGEAKLALVQPWLAGLLDISAYGAQSARGSSDSYTVR